MIGTLQLLDEPKEIRKPYTIELPNGNVVQAGVLGRINLGPNLSLETIVLKI